MYKKGKTHSRDLLSAIAEAMTVSGAQSDSAHPAIPAGYTYLGQFIDHDLSFDKTAVTLGDNITVEELKQGRSPALDLDSLYGRGPWKAEDAKFYSDGIRLKMGRTKGVPGPDNRTNIDRDGFDLPRVVLGSKKVERRAALIPDHRNDENLAVGQTHLAFIRFHNRVADTLEAKGTPSTDLFNAARALVVRHYQWMIRYDFLPRIVDPGIVDDVFTNGRQFFETYAGKDGKYMPSEYMRLREGDMPTMPIEFAVAAYRLGHSMVRGRYQWNRVFRAGGITPATLELLFNFSGTSGTLSPNGAIGDPESGDFEHLPTNWIADFRRLYDFAEVGRGDLAVPPDEFNVAKRIDTLLVDPL